MLFAGHNLGGLNSCLNVEEIICANHCFCVFVVHLYRGNSFFWNIWEIFDAFYSVHGIKCFEKIYKQESCLKISDMWSFIDIRNRQNLKSFGPISLKLFLGFPKINLSFRSDTIKKLGIINLCSKSYTIIVLRDFDVAFLVER